jgi:hypothetical protein
MPLFSNLLYLCIRISHYSDFQRHYGLKELAFAISFKDLETSYSHEGKMKDVHASFMPYD